MPGAAESARLPSGRRAVVVDGYEAGIEEDFPFPAWRVSLRARWCGGCLHGLRFVPIDPTVPPLAEGPLRSWLVHYLEDPHAPPPLLPISLRGTPFQRRVWAALRAIPAGERRSYGELARCLNTSPRAVAAACRTNPWSLWVPCHRVVGRNGVGGFMGQDRGWPVAVKIHLLCHEERP